MKRASERKAVWFNKESQELHADLFKRGLSSRNFQDFVKDAYHDKIDQLKKEVI